MTRVLVIDDEPAILRAMRIALGANGYEVEVAATGMQGVAKAAAVGAQVLVVDLGLPDIDGLEVIRRVRAMDERVPIIVLSAWSEVDTKVRALDLGADDYLEKPFSMPELLARVRVTLRHRAAGGDDAGSETPGVLERGDVRLDLARRTATAHGAAIELTRTQFDLLACFLRHPGRVLTHRAISTEVWGGPTEVDSANLRVVVSQVRRRIEVDPSHPELIRTVLGIGYVYEG